MKKVAALLALALASFALVACGGGSDDSSSTAATGGGESNTEATTPGKANPAGGAASGGGGGSTLQFEADPDGGLAFTSATATAKAGTVTIDFTNPQPLPHDVVIEDSSGKEIGGTEEVNESSASTTVDL